MLNSAEIRQQFLDFFKAKEHVIVPSSPIVIKNDPTLLFTNAGMNQFKEYFLGNVPPPFKRAADTQKCLRVSGKHNDLEEVGVDTYHHTMFEMLGNWSFGDYFKKEAIAWSWELLTKIYHIPEEKLYVTVFEGDAKENLPADEEAIGFWKEWVPEERIIFGNKKDNFWEMGDTGPCGPCTEIHIDSRPDDERKLVDGKTLINKDHPQVIEIWNNVFIEYNRKKDGSLQPLPSKHVDTGLGFERLVRVIQNKISNYDTDVFTGTIAEIEKIAGKKYTNTGSKADVAFRVIADHIRAITFPIADGQLPSNTGAGYVIRRILRRAVRYYFSYLDVKKPLLHLLMPLIAEQFREVFPEAARQEEFITRVIFEEEQNFLRTLEKGLYRIENFIAAERKESGTINSKYTYDNSKYTYELPGNIAFELYDTYGFPLDLTKLICEEQQVDVDEAGFEKEMQQQKNRSRAAGTVDTEDWVIVNSTEGSAFVGYEKAEVMTAVSKYRKTTSQGKKIYQVVLEQTPFYAESGGQVGDTGLLHFADEDIEVINTKKENDLNIQFIQKFPRDISQPLVAKIDAGKRRQIRAHHTATHLLHAALRSVLGNHVAQKGSLVNAEQLRFDFSHFSKVTETEIAEVEALVNEKIRQNVAVVIKEMNKDEAVAIGAMALFGEKYGNTVRVVTIDPAYSIELCGGTHAASTGELGFFKIKQESAVGAGVRRIEAVCAKAGEKYVNDTFDTLAGIHQTLKHPKDISKAIANLVADNSDLKKQVEKFEAKEIVLLSSRLLQKGEQINGITFIGEVIEASNADALKKISLSLKNNLRNYFVVLCAEVAGKAFVSIMIDDTLALDRSLDAVKIIKDHVSGDIRGGGGGQKTFATAGGTNASALREVISKVKALL